MMPLPRWVVWIIPLSCMLPGAGTVCGQNYPRKPIRIVTSEVGGGADFTSRLIAPGLSASLGQQVIIDNRGGSGVIPVETAAKTSPDGYTLLFIGSSLWLFPLLRDHVSYDPMKSFSPITLATSSPTILVVHPTVAANSIRELIALAKATPGGFNYASGPAGSSSHLAAELFKAMAAINIVRVSYKGAGPALNDLIGGQVQMMFPNAASVAPHLKSGKLKALAVTSALPSALVPGVPTATASGLPGYEAAAINGMFAPAGTPATLIDRLNRELVRELNKTDIKEKLFNTGVEVVASPPQQLAATMKSDMIRLGKVIREAGIRSD